MTNEHILYGDLIDEETLITLEELCRHCALPTEQVITLVREGILDPYDGQADAGNAPQWHFHISSVRRVRTTVHLQRDLGVNLQGAALALELLDRIAELQKARSYNLP